MISWPLIPFTHKITPFSKLARLGREAISKSKRNNYMIERQNNFIISIILKINKPIALLIY
jgi:hypothetical protein